jgi:hypothetical protein
MISFTVSNESGLNKAKRHTILKGNGMLIIGPVVSMQQSLSTLSYPK